MLENPLKSFAWHQEPMQAMLAMPGVGSVVTDACVWEKRRPDTGELVKKPTRVIGTQEVTEKLDIRCAGDHEHSVIEGNMRCPDAQGRWKSMKVSEWSGGYTAEFCCAIL